MQTTLMKGVSKRRRRFDRDPEFRKEHSLRVTEDDLKIFRELNRHELLDSRQTAALVDRSTKKVVERLGLLWQHGYIARPNAQKADLIDRAGSQPFYHGLTNRGRRAIGLPTKRLKETSQNHHKHTLFTASIMVAIELACRQRGNVKLAHFDRILSASPSETQESRSPKTLPSELPKKGRRGMTPDTIFALRFMDGRDLGDKYFFLEADRGTEPQRRRPQRTQRPIELPSIAQKVERYRQIYRDGVHRTRFPMEHFRVLFVTNKGRPRVENMIHTARSCIESHHGLFLFISEQELLESDPLAAPWRTGKGKIAPLDEMS